jgi:YesN/AraC family two-component response regulator
MFVFFAVNYLCHMLLASIIPQREGSVMIFSLDAGIAPNVRLIGRIVYAKPWLHFTRVIDEYVLYIIKSGEMYIQEADCKYALKEGDFLLLEPNLLHKGYKKANCDYYYIHFKNPSIRRIEDRPQDDIVHEMLAKRKQSLTSDYLSEIPPTDTVCYFQKHCTLVNKHEFMLLLQNSVDEFYKKHENYKQLVSGRIHELLVKVCREFVATNAVNNQTRYSRASVKAQSMLGYINREYHKKITARDIEELFESNYDYLNRIFHKMTGYTVFNYLNVVRINKAKEIIGTTHMKFSEVGYLVGIEDPYYFSKLFKKLTGMTPTQYWEKVRKWDNPDI